MINTRAAISALFISPPYLSLLKKCKHYLLTFAIALTPTPAAEEWVLHKTIERKGYFRSLAYMKTGDQLAIGIEANDTDYHTFRVYDSDYNNLHGQYPAGEDIDVWSVAFRPGYYTAAVGGEFGFVRIYNTLQNTLLTTVDPPGSDYFQCLAYSPNGTHLAGGTDESNIIIFSDTDGGPSTRYSRTLRGHTNGVNEVAWSPDGRTLASASQDGTVRLWNPYEGINFATLRGHTDKVTTVAFSPDGRTLASGSYDGKVYIWDANTHSRLRTINPFGGVNAVAYHPTKNILAVTLGLTVRFFNPTTGTRTQEEKDIDSGRRNVYTALEFRPDGKHLAVGVGQTINSPRCRIYIFNLITANRLDANKDGQVNLSDLIYVAQNYGRTGNNNADVNNDNRVDIEDLAEVARAVNPNFAAPTAQQPDLPFTVAQVQQWIQDAKAANIAAEDIALLEQLLAAVTLGTQPPTETALFANYPNPFNPETWIPYQLATPAEVTVSIYSAEGTLVRRLALGELPAGVYQDKSRAAYWDGKNAQGETVASGVYFYTLTAGDFSATQKMLIRK